MIDLMLLSPIQLDKFIHMQSIIARQSIEAAKVRAIRGYYDGTGHPTYLSDRQAEFIGKMMTEGEFDFAHNTVRSVVDTLRERLNVSGFTVNGAGLDDEGDASTPERTLASLFWSWWEENRLDAQQIRLHRRAIRDGKSYVMVDYDAENQRPRFTLHEVDDGTTGITCHRDPEMPDVILFLNKHWYTYDPLKPGETGTQRKTTYLPHEIRKYIMGKGGWLRMDGIESPLEDGDAQWPIPWVERDGTPLGITLKEFENPGGSEVAQIIGLQDALNKSWLDLIAAADMAGFPILAIEDGEPESFQDAHANSEQDDDIEGDDEFIVAPGRALNMYGAKAHRIEGADLSQLINVIRLIIETIAGISRTPSYYLTPAAPDASGEALKQRDSGLVKRAEERQLIFGQAWSDVMMLAYRVQRAFGPGQLPEVPKMRVQTQWSDAETRNEKLDAEMGEILKRLGIPDEMLFAKLGFSPAEIKRILTMRRSDQAATLATIATAMQRATPTQSAPTTNVVNNNGNGVRA